MLRRLRTAASRTRLWVERFVFLLVAMLVMRTWCVEGLLVPCPVDSGSMAETLLGVHREVTCDDCGYRFVCGADLQPVSSRAVCPNCGQTANDLAARPDLAGDRVLIAKAIFQFRRPRRWEVVAFRHPGRASQTLVKRVVGLPGESIRIRHGDVYVDGQVQRKTLPEQRALAILVHDANFRPRLDPAPPPRWQCRLRSRWNWAGGRFVCPEAQGNDPADDWLEYRHWRRVPDRPGEVRYGPVTDVCGYNQTRPRREEDVHPVSDLLLSLRLVKTIGRGELVLRATDGGDEFRVRIDPNQRRYEVSRNGRLVAGAAGEFLPSSGSMTLEMSLFDQQLLLAFDGRPVVTLPYGPSPGRQQSCRPLAIGSRGGLGMEIRDLRVYRDVYYTHPIGSDGRWGLDDPVRLAADQYFVLGDNSAISEDSRTWPEGPAVDAKFLVGKPLVVHFPARLVELGPWRFQVPDPARIRYIR
jgi:signal peptidase I